MGLFTSIGNALGDVVGDFTGANAGTQDQLNGINTAQSDLQNGLTQTQALYAPTAQIGTNTINQLSSILNGGNMSQFYNNPAYQYALQQSTRNLNATAASQGTLMSGNTLKALQTNANGLASGNYQNYIGNLTSLFNQTSPYLNTYNNIPNQMGQNNAGLAQAAATARTNQANNNGGSLMGILGGLLGGGASGTGGVGTGGGAQPSATSQIGSGLSSGISNLYNNSALQSLLNSLGGTLGIGSAGASAGGSVDAGAALDSLGEDAVFAL